jgi:predicted AlkP superfamily pyrophosphatase or phosphodiesterase
MFGDRDDQPWETDFPGYGRTFPHAYGPGDGKYFTTLLTVSPAGDELTASFAKALIGNESIGKDDVTDYLAVSFSSTDYVGHLFGPSSLEQEDNLARLDRTLADFLAFVDRTVGLNNTLIVLSADHGGPEAPGSLQAIGIEADYVDPESWDRSAGIAALKERFGIGSELIREYFHPYVYLDREAIANAGLDGAEVEAAVASEIEKLDGVAYAVSSTALTEGRVPDTELTQAVLANHHGKRSGDIFIVFEAHRFINDFDGLTVAATHGSPWKYDTYVPIIFVRPGVEPRKVHRAVRTVDVAPTLSAVVGAKAPSGAVGELLKEVLGTR